MKQIRRVAILGSSRIPFARSNSAYVGKSNQDMLTAAFRGVVDKFQLHGEELGDVVAGAVIKHSRDFSLCRESVLGSGLSPATPAFDIQQACGTGLEAAIVVANKIALGQIEVGMAGGVDTTSDAPIAVSEGLRKILLEANRARDTKGKLAALLKIRPKHLAPLPPANGEPRTKMSMGQHCEVMAQTWGITREAQDEFALNSHKKAIAAQQAGEFTAEITPVTVSLAQPNLATGEIVTKSKVVSLDEGARADSSIEGLAKLKPVFAAKGSVTAGNSSQMSDGAGCLILASEAAVKQFNLVPLAKWRGFAVRGVPPEIMGIGPKEAIPAVLKTAGLNKNDIDWFELNEAFAAQSLAVMKDLELDPAKVNPMGGAIALGHPLGATGAIRAATVVHALRRHNLKYGMVTMCIGTGMGAAGIFERV